MTSKWVQDINDMHRKFGVTEWVNKQIIDGNKENLREFLKFRANFLLEELSETQKAIESNDAEEVVDGLIDLCVVAIGTLDAFGIDADQAWNRVHTANMSKEPGIKPERPNPLGLPDLMKPSNWKAPNHQGNHGYIPYSF